jgi:hypothetical protein
VLAAPIEFVSRSVKAELQLRGSFFEERARSIIVTQLKVRAKKRRAPFECVDVDKNQSNRD